MVPSALSGVSLTVSLFLNFFMTIGSISRVPSSRVINQKFSKTGHGRELFLPLINKQRVVY